MKTRLLIYTFCNMLISIFLFEMQAQTYSMGDNLVTDCSGTLYDSGGASGTYGSNESLTFQICPSDPNNNCVSMDFSFFNLESASDFLNIYDGDATTGNLLGSHSGTAPTSFTSTTGCLTLVFTSDNSGNSDGWEATWSCTPCTSVCGQTVCEGPPPANDACPNATNIGVLPLPVACAFGDPNQGIGDPLVLNALTNLCATAEEPYNYIPDCIGGASMASPAADVWYQMEVTGTALNVSVTNGMPNTSLGLWYDNGGGCGNLAAAGCAVGDGNNLQASFLPLNPGIYYLQVSGGDEQEQCSFNLTLQNNYDCVACLTEQTFTVNPPPIDGVYEAGSTVEFCYTVSQYNQANTNFMHAVVPEFGAGWDIATLLPSSIPNACASTGDWLWYEGTVTGIANGISAGTGFYFETPLPNNDSSNPGDNYGDAGVGINGCSLTFCWQISAINSSNGESLSVVVETYSDSETGAYPTIACNNDPSYTFSANLVNCFLPVADNIPNPNICEGGDVTITASGTNDIVSYQWSANAGGGTSPTVTLAPLVSTEYVVTVTNFCDEIDTETFTVEVIQIDATATTTTAFCDNSATGSIMLTPTGGIEPYNYVWNEASFGDTNNPTNILPNAYTVTVTDNIGCTETFDVTVESDTDLAATATATNTTCFNTNTGTATVNATDGGGNYTYLWNDTNNQTTETATALAAGDYIVTVTDANTCETTASVSVGNAVEITSTISATDAGCDGSTSGTIDLNVSGGTGNYTFIWDNGLPPQEDHNANILGGTYNVTITDENTCTITNFIEVTVPTPMNISITATDVDCNGTTTGTLDASITGGTNPLTYAWSNGLPPQATHNNVSAGTYTVTVTDDDDCSVTENATVNEPALLEIESLNAVDVACNGDASGSIDLNVIGGVGNYTYTWDNGLSNVEDPQNVAMGDYNVTVTDENNCEVQGNINVSEPNVLSIDIEATDVVCNGQNNGTITVTASGGTGNYTYAWDNGITETSAFVDDLDVGAYEVTVTDENNCMIIANATVDEPVVMLAGVATDDASCEGQTDGALNLNVSGGTGTYTYEWDNNLPPQEDHDNVGAGAYSVLVTDENGCTVLGFGTVNAPSGLTLTNTTVDVSCNGGATGSIDLTVTGGQNPYNYTWDNNLPSQEDHTISLAANTYSVTVSDANGCENTTSIEIFEPQAIIIELTATDISCNGANDGTIETEVTGGDFPYNFQWTNNLGNQPIHNNLVAGIYFVTVTDDSSCSNTASVEIVEPNAMTSSIQTTDATCGQSDGSATVTPSGGATPYTYNWNTTPPQNGATANNLSAGNYNVTITDNSNCFIVETVNISDAGGPTATTGFNNPTCGLANGDATITVTGGSTPYLYIWDANANGQTTAMATDLAAGTYNVTVTDANNCAVSETFILTDDGVPNASISTTETACGQDNGTATITVNSGGTPNYNFVWDTNANSQTTAIAIGLAVGSYDVTISDANGCETVETATITAGQSTITTTSSTPASCGESNGSATITVNSGNPPFIYLWDTNANSQNTSTANNLAAGDYTVTLTDGDLCEIIETITIANNGAIPNITMSATNASCGQNNGTATVTVVQEFPPYIYSWNDANNQFAETAIDLAAGNYEVIVTDDNGCQNTATVMVGNDGQTTINIINILPTTCGENNGSAEVEINGTATPYDILWNDANGQITAIATDLAAGDYEVTVTDGNGCENVETVNIATSEAIEATLDVTNSSCGTANGTATLTVTSGAGNYQYEWDANANSQTTATANNLAAGAYDYTITDSENCELIGTANISDEGGPTASISIDNEPTCGNANGSATVTINGGQGNLDILWSDNGQTTATAVNLAAGNYTVTVTDENNCIVTESIILTDAGLPTATATTTAATCELDNGEATITPNGGTGNYTYLWDDINAQTTATATNLAAGTYEPTITDANNCSITLDVTVDAVLNVTLNISVTDANCGQANGAATITPVNGTPPLEFLWNDANAQTTVTATGLLAGVYTVSVTDANDCIVEANITINNIGGPTTSISATAATCGQTNGTATLTVVGGIGVTYLWDDANAQTTATAIDLPAGFVSCTITDANGCTVTETIEVPSSDSPILDISATTASCGQDDGTATVVITSGGQTPFTYLWDDANAQTTATATNLAAGNYIVTVTDATLCEVTASIEVTSTDALQIDISATQDFCGQALGTATATVLNGQTPFTYEWNDINGQTTEIATALIANNYTVTVTDGNGCEATASIEVTEIEAPTASISNTTDASCGQADGTATVTASGGGTTYTYLWDLAADAQITETAIDLSAGSYVVTVTDENNCSAEATANISNLDAPTISIASTDTDCGVANGTATITASGGIEPYTYLWSNDSTTAVIDALLPATYTVTLTDDNGCEAVESVTINGNIATPAPICFEQTSSSITIIWESIVGAIDYEVEINNNTQTVVDTFFVVENLAQAETVTINVIANGDQACGLSTPAPISCTTTTENCPPADATFDNLATTYCVEDTAFELAATPAGGIFNIDGVANISFNPQAIGSGQHEVTYSFTDENNCLFTASQIVEISAVTASISPTTITIAPAGSATLNVNANSALGNTIQYLWSEEPSLDCTDCETVIATPSENTTYTVLVADEYGCVDNATAFVSVVANNTVAIPTAFTPNGDGQNDEFKIIGSNISEVELSVYNRWGNELFTTKDISQTWNGQKDGRDADVGVYVYYAKIIFTDKSEELFKGNVTLIR